MSQNERDFSNTRRRMLKLTAGLGAALAIPAGAITCNHLLSSEAVLIRRADSLDRAIGNDLDRLLTLSAGIKQFASEAFALHMHESYGLTYNPAALSGKVKILNSEGFRLAIAEDSGCTNPPGVAGKAGVTTPDYDFIYVDAEVIRQNIQGESLSLTKETASVIHHELSHSVPITVLDPVKAAPFQSTVTNPGWNVVGMKGFALIVEAPSLNKPDRSCLGRPTQELLLIEEAKAETDRIGTNSKAGLGIKGVKEYELLAEKMEGLILSRLSTEDRRRIGVMHAASDLEGLLGFYKQNFNFQGTIAETYTHLNRRLSGILD